MVNRTRLGIICALSAAGFYGLVPNFVRGAFNNGIPPVEATLFRTAVIALAFALVALSQGERLLVPRGARWIFAGQAAATLVVSVSYLASVQFIPVGLAVIIFFTFPVLIMLVSPIIEGRRPDPCIPRAGCRNRAKFWCA
jgi:drug/metabolite transporter (DMT)-like permease